MNPDRDKQPDIGGVPVEGMLRNLLPAQVAEEALEVAHTGPPLTTLEMLAVEAQVKGNIERPAQS